LLGTRLIYRMRRRESGARLRFDRAQKIAQKWNEEGGQGSREMSPPIARGLNFSPLIVRVGGDLGESTSGIPEDCMRYECVIIIN
jgi:hypothetical protein